MVNKYYRYDNYDLWDDEKWQGRLTSPMYPLVQWLGKNDSPRKWTYPSPVDGIYDNRCADFPFYTKKTNCVDAPDVTKYWADRGMFYSARSLGGVRWLVFCPASAVKDHQHKMKTLVIYHQEDYSDPYWAMKMFSDYDSWLNMAADDKDTILMFFITEGPETGGYFVEILQEATTCYPIDKDRMFLDMTLLKKAGASLCDVDGYIYTDRNGAPVSDPDSFITSFGALGIPALDISGRWPSLYCLNRKQILIDDYSSALYDRDRMIHSATAERMSEGIAMDHRFDFADTDEFRKYWEDMGLRFDIRYTKGERWMVFTPMSAFETDDKLPLLIAMQEVGSGNDHLAVTSINYLYEYVRLAAQGEFIALFFVMEDPDSNEVLMDILSEAKCLYPIDDERMYISGHSHNGAYSNEFYRRHPKMIAGAAILGNSPAYMPPSGGAPGADNTDEKIEADSHEDMPLIDMVGTCEFALYFPVAGEHTGRRVGVTGSASTVFDNVEDCILGWQRRLYASNCPMKTKEEIVASLSSPDSCTRFLGFPADKTEILYLDGVNHYIGDIKNNDGKYHLRIVGIDNLPHLPTPSMMDLAWSFLKRFKRDQATGKVIELY